MRLVHLPGNPVDKRLHDFHSHLHMHLRNPEFDFYKFSIQNSDQTAQALINKNTQYGSRIEAIALQKGLYVHGSRIQAPDAYWNQGVLSRISDLWWEQTDDIRLTKHDQLYAVGRFLGNNDLRLELHVHKDIVDQKNPAFCLYTPNMQFSQ